MQQHCQEGAGGDGEDPGFDDLVGYVWRTAEWPSAVPTLMVGDESTRVVLTAAQPRVEAVPN